MALQTAIHIGLLIRILWRAGRQLEPVVNDGPTTDRSDQIGYKLGKDRK